MKRILLTGLILTVLLTAGCARGAGAAQAEGPVVVASLFAPYDFARQIARGTGARVEMLMKPGVEPHAFDPAPTDMLRIAQADLFIYVGGESEAWVDRLFAAPETRARALRLMDAVTVLDEEIVPGMQAEEEEAEPDEHIWTSPVNAMAISRAIADALIEVDPQNANAYRANLEAYLAELHELDQSFEAVVQGGARREIVFGDRFPMRYFAQRYGLAYAAAFPGCGHDTEPSAATLAFLIGEVRAKGIPTVYHIEQGNVRMAEAIAGETGARAMLMHACHNISKDDFEAGATYMSLMKNNVEALKAGLF